MAVNVSGDVVRRLRLERGWTQEQLATIAETSVKTIQRVERTGICGIETRSALAAVFEIQLKQLDGEERIQQAKSAGAGGVLFYHRVLTGNGLVEVFQNTLAYRFTHEDARNAEDAEIIASALQEIQDWSEIWDDIDAGGRVRATFDLGERIKELESQGIWAFGLRTRTSFAAPHRDGSTGEIKGAICNVHLAYADSDRVIILNPSAGAS